MSSHPFRPLTEDYVAAVNIPTKIDSVPTNNGAVERLLKKREKAHEAVLHAMRLHKQDHNQAIEEEIREESEILKDTLQEIRTKIDTELGQILKNTDEELIAMNSEIFQKVSIAVQDLNEQRLAKIDLFSKKIDILEKKRSKLLKGVLNEAYKEATNICHILPYELLDFFEREILALNEITMGNYRSYAKIQADLKLQMQEEMRTILLEIVDVKDRHKTVVETAKAKREDTSKLVLPELDTLEAQPPSNCDGLEMWTYRIKATMERLDAKAQKLVELYRVAVMDIFNRFFDELRALADALTEEESIELKTPDLDCSKDSDLYEQLVEDLRQLYSCDISDLQSLWDSIAAHMESDIQNTHRFLEGSVHLWDAHFSRISESKTLILEHLQLVIQKHDKIARDLDKKVNTTLDKLREGSTVMKLNEHLQEANRFLDSIAKLYSSQCNDEISIFKKYKNLVDQGIDLLIGEIERFLDVTAKNEGIQARRSWASLRSDTEITEQSYKDSKEALIPHQMKAARYQVDAVNNWMFGLWEAIRHYLGACRAELTHQAEVWIANVIVELKKRLEIRLAVHKPRYVRVKTMIYDVRLKEIEEHSGELQRVEENMKRFVGDSASFNHTAKESRASLIRSYETSLKEIEGKLKRATKSLQVASCTEQTKMAARETLAKLNENFRENDELVERNRSNIDKAICQFSSGIKLFSEGGKYNRDEAKLLKKKVQKSRKGVVKKYQKVVDEYSAVKKDTLLKFEHSEAAILARLDLCEKELDHCEKICSKIKDVQHEIRSLAYEVKFKIHRIDASVDYYREMSKIEIWKWKNFEIMREVLEDCLQKVQEVAGFLITDYVQKVDEVLDRASEDIENVTEIFYERHGSIINKGKIPTSSGAFVAEVGKSFDGFRKQVEVHCLELIQELTNHVVKFLKTNDEVYASLVAKFPKIGGENEETEESEKLGVGLDEESLRSEKKKILERRGAAAAAEILQTNEGRVRILQSLLVKLWDKIQQRVDFHEIDK